MRCAHDVEEPTRGAAFRLKIDCLSLYTVADALLVRFLGGSRLLLQRMYGGWSIWCTFRGCRRRRRRRRRRRLRGPEMPSSFVPGVALMRLAKDGWHRHKGHSLVWCFGAIDA